MSDAAAPSCAYCTARRITSSPCCCSPSLTHAVPRMPRPLAMRARASEVSICPSGVRRKMASGAGQAPEELDDLGVVALVGGHLGLGHLGEVDGGARSGGGAVELLPDVGADAGAELVELEGLVDAVVEEGQARDAPLDEEAAQAVAVERRQEQVAHADVELERLDVGVALGRGRHGVVREERAHQAVTEVGQGEALDVRVAFVLAGGGDDEVDESVVGGAPVDGERGDPRAGDHREGEERLADDVAQGLEAPDPISDAFEPPVGAHRVEREDAFPGHIVQRRSVARHAVPCHLAR